MATLSIHKSPYALVASAHLRKGESVRYTWKCRTGYTVMVARGCADLNGVQLEAPDFIEVSSETEIEILSRQAGTFVLILLDAAQFSELPDVAGSQYYGEWDTVLDTVSTQKQVARLEDLL